MKSLKPLNTRLKKRQLAGALIILTAWYWPGCASAPHKNSGLTQGNVKSNVVKGQTTQAEIVQLLGSPNLVSKNKSGAEVWTYSRQSYDSESGGYGGGVILFGGSKAFSSSSSSSFDLILTFNDHDVVQDYSIVTSQF